MYSPVAVRKKVIIILLIHKCPDATVRKLHVPFKTVRDHADCNWTTLVLYYRHFQGNQWLQFTAKGRVCVISKKSNKTGAFVCI